jgi:hypothetical protein
MHAFYSTQLRLTMRSKRSVLLFIVIPDRVIGLLYILDVWLRQFLLENFAGDLEYHPRRAAVYLILAAGALSFWIFSPPENKFTTTPLVFVLGSLMLFAKGIYLLRKSSEGLGLTISDLAALSAAPRKNLPALPEQAAQIAQDFGAGSLLLWPLLNSAKEFDHSWIHPPYIPVFFSGAVVFTMGWLIRRLTSRDRIAS